MSRWRVYKDESEFEWAPWHATDGRYLYQTQSFADALAHADRRARTIQVTLPRKLSLPGVYLEWDRIGFRKIHAEDCPIDIEYLGTALLALHHRKRVTIHQ